VSAQARQDGTEWVGDAEVPSFVPAAGQSVSWRDVDVWTLFGRVAAERLDPGSVEHILALREYRDTGRIVDCYLAPPSGDPDDDSDCAGGPAVDEIDWAGIDSSEVQA
jgi:hypothetical protein